MEHREGTKGKGPSLSNLEPQVLLETKPDLAKKPASSALPPEHLDLSPVKWATSWEWSRARGVATLPEGMRGKQPPHGAACSIPKVE